MSRLCKRGHDLDVHQNKHRQCKLCMALWREEHPEACKNKSKRHAFRWRLKNVYGITQEQYDKMFLEQGGLCILPSCRQPIGATDHCHRLKKVRGLMCERHNLALGLFSDDPVLLREAAEYLEKFYGQ